MLEPPSPEQDELMWILVQDWHSAYLAKRVNQGQLVSLFFIAKGTANLPGLRWQDIGPKLEPRLRGPMAYLLGCRHLGLKQPGEAASYFRAALEVAPPDSPNARLAQTELDRLNVPPQPLTSPPANPGATP